MARPRNFDENAVLDAAMQRFWSRGYEVTSVRELADGMGLTSASLYNAFGDKLGSTAARCSTTWTRACATASRASRYWRRGRP